MPLCTPAAPSASPHAFAVSRIELIVEALYSQVPTMLAFGLTTRKPLHNGFGPISSIVKFYHRWVALSKSSIICSPTDQNRDNELIMKCYSFVVAKSLPPYSGPLLVAQVSQPAALAANHPQAVLQGSHLAITRRAARASGGEKVVANVERFTAHGCPFFPILTGRRVFRWFR